MIKDIKDWSIIAINECGSLKECESFSGDVERLRVNLWIELEKDPSPEDFSRE